jgi:hypothetical protein
VSFAGVLRLAALGAAASVAGACGAAAQGRQSTDPMKCERDPQCTKARAGYRDCSFQCQDDPACMDRCREADPDGLGHPQ